MLHRQLTILALCFGIAACEAPSRMDTAAQAAPTASTPAKETRMDTTAPEPVAASAAGNADDLDGLLKKGTPYADVRAALLADGWQPVRDAQCRANVVGGSHASLCAENPGLAGCKACDELPELSSSSGDGHSLMRFSRTTDSRSLQLTTYGMLGDGLVTGPDSRLNLWTWSFDKEGGSR